MPKAKTQKSNSLKELGYTFESASGKDSKGNEITLKVTKGDKSYFLVTTKRGRIMAIKDPQNPAETTIEGLYQFKEVGGDLVGKRQPPTPAKPKEAPTPVSA